MRAALVVVLGAAACGGGGGGGVGEIDAGTCSECTPNPDAGMYTWTLEPRVATTIYRFEDDNPLTEGRSTRVALEHSGLSCDLWAMPLVEIEDADNTVTITPRVFARTPPCTLTASQTRVVTITLTTGTWTVIGGAGSTATPLSITAGPQPERACGLAPCTLDCDCDEAAGERCLGAQGFGGPYLSCVRPCEHSRDCGDGVCVDIADGPFRTCDAAPECTDDVPCPAGYTCATGFCAPTFVLGQSTRGECTTDQDCSGGLRCVVATAGSGPNRCEVACRTGGGWCQGAHICGPAATDLSGLARSDSVCGWLGE